MYYTNQNEVTRKFQKLMGSLSTNHVFSSKNGHNYYISINFILFLFKKHQIVETSINNVNYSILSVN